MMLTRLAAENARLAADQLAANLAARSAVSVSELDDLRERIEAAQAVLEDALCRAETLAPEMTPAEEAEANAQLNASPVGRRPLPPADSDR